MCDCSHDRITLTDTYQTSSAPTLHRHSTERSGIGPTDTYHADHCRCSPPIPHRTTRRHDQNRGARGETGGRSGAANDRTAQAAQTSAGDRRCGRLFCVPGTSKEMRQEEAVLYAMLGPWERLLGIQDSLDVERGSRQQRETARIVLANRKVQEGGTKFGTQVEQEEERGQSIDRAKPVAPRRNPHAHQPALSQRERRGHHEIQFHLDGSHLDDHVTDAPPTQSRLAPNRLPRAGRHRDTAHEASPTPLAAAAAGARVSDRTRARGTPHVGARSGRLRRP